VSVADDRRDAPTTILIQNADDVGTPVEYVAVHEEFVARPHRGYVVVNGHQRRMELLLHDGRAVGTRSRKFRCDSPPRG
jgi:hypothetical protein